MRALPILPALVIALVAASSANAQAVSYASPATATRPSDPSRAVWPEPVYQTEASQRALAKRLVALINEGRCDRARLVAENDRDRSAEMTHRVAYFCSKRPKS